MTRLTLNRIAIKGISQHKTPFIAKLPHANRVATDKKGHFRVLFHRSSTTNFSTKNHDNDSGTLCLWFERNVGEIRNHAYPPFSLVPGSFIYGIVKIRFQNNVETVTHARVAPGFCSMRVLLLTLPHARVAHDRGGKPYRAGAPCEPSYPGCRFACLGQSTFGLSGHASEKMALPEFTVRLQDGSRTEEIPLFCFFRVQLTRNCALKPFGFLAFLLTLHENPINAWMH